MTTIGDAKALLRRALPGLYVGLWKVRNRRSLRDERARHERIVAAISGGGALAVRGGPFAGMAYVPESAGSALYPKLLGCYEAELHDAVERLIADAPAEVVNIGCGEGYYAVGLALRLPGARVHAFDADPAARHWCESMARANGVSDRVRVGGVCGPEELRALADARPLIVCDCEGCELELLRPDLVPGLGGCDLLVELHDFVDRGITRTILSRFAPTHEITLVDTVERDPEAYPLLRNLSPEERWRAVQEGRPEPMQWALMRPKAPHAPA